MESQFEAVQMLIIALFIDLIGMSSLMLPGMGEFFDTVWAPISGYLISKIFDNKIMGTVGFMEEILPFTDFIPTATLAWAQKYWWFVMKVANIMIEFQKTQKNKKIRKID